MKSCGEMDRVQPGAKEVARGLAFLKGTGFSPYINHPTYDGLLAPEGIYRAGLGSPRRLKPIHLDCQM